MLTSLPMSEIEKADKRADSERSSGAGPEMKREVSRWTLNGSRLFIFSRKKRKTSTRNWKACDIVVLAMVMIATVSIHAIPAVIYFAKQVRGKYYCILSKHAIKAFDEHMVKVACACMYYCVLIHACIDTCMGSKEVQCFNICYVLF